MSLSTFRIAWRNLGRNKRRTFLAGGAIALGQFTLVFVNGLMAGSFHDMLTTLTGPMVGHVQLHHPDWREERAVDLYVDDLAATLEEISALPEVTGVSARIFSPVLSASGEISDEPADAEPGVVVGIDPEAESARGGLLEDLSPEERPGDGGVLVGRVLANRLGVQRGELLAIIGQDADGFPVSELYTIRGILNSKVDIVKTLGVVMSLDDAGFLLTMPDQAHEVIVMGDDHRLADALAEKVRGLPAAAAAEVMSWRDAIPQLTLMIDMKGYFDLVFLMIVFVAAAAGIANTAVMSTFERTREFGMLLAVGSSPGRVIGMVLIESVILGLTAVAVGSVLGTILVLVTGHTGIDYAAFGGADADSIAFKGMNFSYTIYPRFEFRHILFGVCAVTITSILASLWPASLSARLEPVEAMRS